MEVFKITFELFNCNKYDNEHLDFYKNFKNLENSFINFINKTPPIGKSIICIDDKNIKK